MIQMTDETVLLLRHAIATLAYRAAKPLRDAPPGFADVRAGEGCRSAGENLGHLGDLIEWAERSARGDTEWRVAPSQPWMESVARFYAALAALDRQLANEPMQCSPLRMLQGPIADAFTHVGQLSTLRRLAGSPVRSENYAIAQIEVGRVGLSQAKPKFEFD
jgi:hypothetical protein